jgi:hypothetical protein
VHSINECSGDLLPPSRPAEKTTAREDQARKASTSDGGGDTTGDCRIVVSLKAALLSAAQHKLSDGFPRTGLDVEVVRELRRDAKE